MTNHFCLTRITGNDFPFGFASFFARLNLVKVFLYHFSQHLLIFVSAQTKKQIHQNQRFINMQKLLLSLFILISQSLFSQGLEKVLDINRIPLKIGVLVDKEIKGDSVIEHSGTAFVIKKESDFFLVTAAHVAKRISKNGTLSFFANTSQLLSLKLSNFFFANKSPNLFWNISDSSDVAIVRLANLGKNKPLLEYICFSYEMLETQMGDYPRDLQTYYFGYPYYFQSKYSTCFTQRSFFSSGLIFCKIAESENRMGYHLTLEDPSIQGFSGGPVLVNVSSGVIYSEGSETKITGIVSGTISDNTGGKTGLIAPAYYIAKVINNYK